MAETEPRNLLDDVRAAMEEVEAPEPAPIAEKPEAPPEIAEGETAQQKADRARDEAGRFAKETKPRETLKVKDPGVAAVVKEEIAATGEAKTPDERHAAAPVEWKGAGKVQWDKLPLSVREQIHDDHRAVATARAEYEPMQAAITPYKEAWVRDAGSVPAAISQLGQFYELFLTNPVGLIQHIARARGIDLGQPGGQPPQGGTQQAPDFASLVKQAVQQEIAPIKQQFAQTENQQLQSVIDAFQADPRHPYFQDVKADMGFLMNGGKAKDMEDAYDKAVRMNPAIWSQVEAHKAEAAKAEQAAQVAKARQASAVNLSGSPIPGAANGAGTKGQSVLDTVRNAFAEQEGA